MTDQEKPEKIPLSDTEYKQWHRYIIKHGFLPFEATEFLTAKGGKDHDVEIDIRAMVTSGPFRDMLNSRLDWINTVKAQGWKKKKIGQALIDYYKLKAGRSPFDFLKIEYKPPKKLSDYAAAIKLRANSRIRRMSKSHFDQTYKKGKIKREYRPLDNTSSVKHNPIDNLFKGMDNV